MVPAMLAVTLSIGERDEQHPQTDGPLRLVGVPRRDPGRQERRDRRERQDQRDRGPARQRDDAGDSPEVV
jgi:hypothetical protein